MNDDDIAGAGNMDALERALVDLGAHLDQPDGNELATAVVDAVRRPHPAPARTPTRGRSPRRWLRPPPRVLLIAATVAAVMLGMLAFTPTRQAIAQLFGIGTVAISNDPAPPPTGRHELPGTPGSTTPTATGAPASVRRVPLDDARDQVPFRIRVPTDRGARPPDHVEIDDRAPGGLVVLDYPDFSLVEVASPPGEAPAVGKSVQPGTRIEPVDVHGSAGIWLEGDPHSVGYLDRTGRFQADTVRRAGNVLVWTADGATYRLEGIADRSRALALAATMMSN